MIKINWLMYKHQNKFIKYKIFEKEFQFNLNINNILK